ncbi:hypothetical protein DL991_32360 [Amycolatopsis sp. WAC 01375]|uniref:TniQ family protein n=1 Tax=Amycolatopsis sp. WAC 01375 TaxID=2203194 RepID=UPI000F78AC4F|nr:TniQ family protein [Amycolatopsis sp. WAC 01375]RSM72898.1 hypothetical protein DL991_32360 [Amycolatopsis sp. WAC 01375]
MTPLRRLPVRLAPVPGESLDSWLAAFSRRLATPARDLLPALGLDVTTLRGSTTGLAVVLRDDEATQVAKATGVPVPTLHMMTLARYNAVLRTDPSTRRLMPYHAWTRRRGTWFCPRCLAETGGRWQLRWRLGWSFACVRHRCLLVDRCPDCGQIPRPDAGLLHIPLASRCGARPATASRTHERCGADLTASAPHELAGGHAVLAAQRLIDTMLTTGTATFGLYTATAAGQVFTDLAVLAPRILGTAAMPHAADPAVGDLAEVYQASLSEGGTAYHGAGSGPGHAVHAAVAVTRAMAVLSKADATAAAAALAALPAPGITARRLVSPHDNGPARSISTMLTDTLQRARHTLFPRPPSPSKARTARPRTPSGRRHDLLGSVQHCPDHDRAPPRSNRSPCPTRQRQDSDGPPP